MIKNNYYCNRAGHADKIYVTTISSDFESEKAIVNKNSNSFLKIRVPRRAAVLQMYASFYNESGYLKTFCASYLEFENGFDVYTLELNDIVYKSDIYNVKFDCNTAFGKKYFSFNGNIGYLSENEGIKYQLLVIEKKYKTPNWLSGGIIYHIFVDRFFKSGLTPKRNDAVYYDDWYDTVPEYPEKVGDFLNNNTFFGGTIWGIIEKLDYIASLGTGTIYLSPIFKAYSNHKYDTGDYLTVDECFGGDEALKILIEECNKRKMNIILDGVFNHVGEDSIYFNKFGKYDSVGAFQSKESPYYTWFNFYDYPHDYDSWWGIKNLPKVNKITEFKDFICKKVIPKYMKMGISGWRLDVADELDGSFLKQITESSKSEKEDSVIIGEVWEDASCKSAYGESKHYFDDDRLDGVTNYPLRDGIISFLKSRNSRHLKSVVQTLNAHYPKDKHDYLMNILGTHDTERILTVLGDDDSFGLSNSILAHKKMSCESREKALSLLQNGYLIISALPGVPCVYYGDEAGLEGYHDPFNRRTYPWGKEDKDNIEFYKKVGNLRKSKSVLQNGELGLLECDDNIFAFERYNENERIIVIANFSEADIEIPVKKSYRNLLTDEILNNKLIAVKEKTIIIEQIPFS